MAAADNTMTKYEEVTLQTEDIGKKCLDVGMYIVNFILLKAVI